MPRATMHVYAPTDCHAPTERYLTAREADDAEAAGLIVECSECSRPDRGRLVYHQADDAATCVACHRPFTPCPPHTVCGACAARLQRGPTCPQ